MKLSKQYNSFSKEFSASIQTTDNISRSAFYRHIPNSLKGMTILDLACGDGQDIPEYKKRGAVCHGIDASENLISIAKEQSPNLPLVVGDMKKLPYKNNSFDAVFSKYAIGTEKDIDLVFNEAHRVLRKGGMLIYLTTHPFRLFMEQKGTQKDYFEQTNVDLSVFGGAFTITEPSHTFNEFFSKNFFEKFSLQSFHEEYDPQSANFPGRDIYPDFFIVTAIKK